MIFEFVSDPFSEVRKVIKSWRPRGCKTEPQYKKSLASKLESELKKRKVEREYGTGLRRVDIVVDGKVPIEMKRDLTSQGVLQRTIGQLDLYLKDWDKVFLVICGEVRPELLKSLKEYTSKKYHILGGERVEIIVK